MQNEENLIFISYATPDRERVIPFADWLNNEGFNVFMDFRNVMPGQRWDFEIKRALKKATFFLMFLSENSVDRRSYLQRELKTALDIYTEKLVDDIYLIPILLDKVTIPEEIKDFQYVDSKESDCQQKILKSIKNQLSRYGIQQKQVQEEGNIKWSSQILKEEWDGLPGYDVELQLITLHSEKYKKVSEINEFMKGSLLRGLLTQRADKLEQDSSRFNFMDNLRTNSYYASCESPSVVGQVISLIYTIDWYGAGAAHPNHHFETFSFILEPVIYIERLESIFKDGYESFPTIQKITREKLGELRFGDDGDEEEESIKLQAEDIFSGTKSWEDFSSFAFLKDGIEILFHPYHVGCYALGSHSIKIHYEEIIHLIKDEYIKALDINFIRFNMADAV